MDVFACRQCHYPPDIGCVTCNSSTGFPDAKLRGLKCPRGRSYVNWAYVDRFMMREHVKDRRFPSKGVLRQCYSQKDLKQGLTLAEFYKKQGRIETKGEWQMPRDLEETRTEVED